jgi:hypothetical protein
MLLLSADLISCENIKNSTAEYSTTNATSSLCWKTYAPVVKFCNLPFIRILFSINTMNNKTLIYKLYKAQNKFKMNSYFVVMNLGFCWHVAKHLRKIW